MFELLELLAPLYPVIAPAFAVFLVLLELGMFKMVLDTRRIVIQMNTKQGLCEVCPQRSAPAPAPLSSRVPPMNILNKFISPVGVNM